MKTLLRLLLGALLTGCTTYPKINGHTPCAVGTCWAGGKDRCACHRPACFCSPTE